MQEHSRILNHLQYQQIQMNSAYSLPGVNNVGASVSYNTIHRPGSAHAPRSPHIPHPSVVLEPALGFRPDQYNPEFLCYYHQQHQAPPYLDPLHEYMHGPAFP